MSNHEKDILVTAVGGAEGSVGSAGSPSRPTKPSALPSPAQDGAGDAVIPARGLAVQIQCGFRGVASRDWEAFG